MKRAIPGQLSLFDAPATAPAPSPAPVAATVPQPAELLTPPAPALPTQDAPREGWYVFSFYHGDQADRVAWLRREYWPEPGHEYWCPAFDVFMSGEDEARHRFFAAIEERMVAHTGRQYDGNAMCRAEAEVPPLVLDVAIKTRETA